MAVECKRCLYNSSHPLGLTIDEEGICSGCRVHEEKDRLDWNARFNELKTLTSKYKSKSNYYDCIVPVTGGRDSHFILHTVVNKLKMKPLVVAYNKYFNTQTGIDNLSNLRIKFNVDFQLKNVDPRVVKKITRTSLYEYGNVYWHCLAGETVFPVQTAVMMQIPLIIWGAHQGLEQVGMYSHLNNIEMTRRYRKDHDLFGVENNQLHKTSNLLTEEDLINYAYPSFSDIEGIGVRGIYLGNYIRWDQWAQHIEMQKLYGFKGRELQRTFDPFDHADCFVYPDIHDILKFYKHGYSKVTDQVTREIRFGRISKKNGIRIVNYYEKKPLRDHRLFAEWLGIDHKNINFILDRFRNKKYWSQISHLKWRKISKGFDEECKSVPKYMKIKGTDGAKLNKKYITIAKGV